MEESVAEGKAAASRPTSSQRSALPHSYVERTSAFRDLLKQNVIDMDKLRSMSFEGVPDELRPLSWKLLFNYLSPDRGKWEEKLKSSKEMYISYCDELIAFPKQAGDTNSGRVTQPEDHPLSDAPDSSWKTFLSGMDLMTTIDKDVRRILPGFHFFSQDTIQLIDDFDEYTIAEAFRMTEKKDHSSSLRRILFVWAKLNSGISYVQGMNELLAPIYYVFATDSENLENQVHAEADAFYVFASLMSEVRDNFVKDMDMDSLVGISSSVHKMNDILKEKDPSLWGSLRDKKVLPEFYAIRWIALLLSQTFTFCGTPEYLAPEILDGSGHGKAVDWWALGTLGFEMLTGLPPFYSQNVNIMYHKILFEEVEMPEWIEPSTQEFLLGLLQKDPVNRLGGSFPDIAHDIRTHPYFEDFDWGDVFKRRIEPNFKPPVSSLKDASQFDPEFTTEVAIDSVVEQHLKPAEEDQQLFEGFTYTRDDGLATAAAMRQKKKRARVRGMVRAPASN